MHTLHRYEGHIQTSFDFNFFHHDFKQADICVVFPILLVTVVIVNQASAGQLKTLVEKHFVPDFRYGGLVLRGHTQFAIVAFLPDTQWMKFLYTPSKNRDGQKPVIDPNSSLSPPDKNNAWYNNYLAARPYKKVHSETQILERLNNLYNQYKGKHRSPPQAMLLYSWIVPCMRCTDNLVAKLTSESYKSIPTKVVAYICTLLMGARQSVSVM